MDQNQIIRGPELTLDGVDTECFWFCVQTHPKHEHIAAASLAKAARVEVFNPQVKFRRATKRGLVWFTESAFSGYIFARFNLPTQLQTVSYSASVSRVVHFNSGYPSIPDEQMGELQAAFGKEEILILSSELGVGDTVRIVGGAFHDLMAVVKQILPAKQRAQALLEFLGQMTIVELDLGCVVLEERCQAPARISARAQGLSDRWLGRSL